jgi:hypothetical protein
MVQKAVFMSFVRSRWAAVGAAVAVTLGAGGIGYVSATNPADASAFVPITPCRLVDTRPAPDTIGPRDTPLGANEAYNLGAHGAQGNCNLPTTANGLALNVTAIGPTEPTFLTIYPSSTERPTSSNLNPVPGSPPTPNAVTTDISVNGRFNIYNLAGNVNVIVDVVGYYTDHDHDDRYYTEAEVDALTTLTPVAGGFVQADATVSRGVGIDSVTFFDAPPGNNTDHYEITLTGINYSGIAYATLVTTSCPGADAATTANGGELWVYIEIVGSADTLGQCGFAFTVTPLPAG